MHANTHTHIYICSNLITYILLSHGWYAQRQRFWRTIRLTVHLAPRHKSRNISWQKFAINIRHTYRHTARRMYRGSNTAHTWSAPPPPARKSRARSLSLAVAFNGLEAHAFDDDTRRQHHGHTTRHERHISHCVHTPNMCAPIFISYHSKSQGFILFSTMCHHHITHVPFTMCGRGHARVRELRDRHQEHRFLCVCVDG